ncbi:hypothetical protein [Thalassolituus sp.]|jgi:hypothetical protein|uniref:hypothetical protein n=1 Tax=Thalassolituus sp. TaxID=2030822 RepID=UPI0027D524D8|nr:hypothetical protein [Thalassolituus sp.]MDQ4426203.1 hypothetical protein [Thalassolituus sp.]
MISYRLPEEKTTLLHYAKLLGDLKSEEIIRRGELNSREEAIHFAEFFWRVVKESNHEDEKNGNNSEYILEKIIISLMAYFRSSGFEDEWEEVSDRD